MKWVGWLVSLFLIPPAWAEQQRTYSLASYRLEQLADEIETALPSLKGKLQVYVQEGSIQIHAAEGLDLTGLDVLVAAHVPAAVWPPVTPDETELATLDAQLDTDFTAWDGLTTAQKLAVAKKLLRREGLKRKLGR